MYHFIIAVATGGYSGYLPKAPGTWGSLVGVLLFLGLRLLPLSTYLLVVALLFGIGVFAAGSMEKIVDCADPGIVVIDEIVGQLITLASCPLTLPGLAAGFAFFRLFDILKPFPVGWLDRHIHGGLGIMLDDVIAGVYGFFLLQLFLRLFSLF